jgi:hypothetical protein
MNVREFLARLAEELSGSRVSFDMVERVLEGTYCTFASAIL